MNAFPLNVGPDGAGDGRSCSTDGGGWQFQGYDENRLCRSLNGRLIGAHKLLRSAGEIACKVTTRFLLGMRPCFRDFSAQQNWP